MKVDSLLYCDFPATFPNRGQSESAWSGSVAAPWLDQLNKQKRRVWYERVQKERTSARYAIPLDNVLCSKYFLSSFVNEACKNDRKLFWLKTVANRREPRGHLWVNCFRTARPVVTVSLTNIKCLKPLPLLYCTIRFLHTSLVLHMHAKTFEIRSWKLEGLTNQWRSYGGTRVGTCS